MSDVPAEHVTMQESYFRSQVFSGRSGSVVLLFFLNLTQTNIHMNDVLLSYNLTNFVRPSSNDFSNAQVKWLRRTNCGAMFARFGLVFRSVRNVRNEHFYSQIAVGVCAKVMPQRRASVSCYSC